MSEIATKELPGGRTAAVVLLTFGRARIVVGYTGELSYIDGW